MKMKNQLKISLLVLLFISSTPSFSQSVVKIVENIEASFYIRTDTLKKVGGSVDFWQIIDYKQAKVNKKGEQYLSIEQHLVLDCVSNTQNLIYIRVFSSPMLTGSMLANGAMNQKNPIPSGTSLEIIKNFVCR